MAARSQLQRCYDDGDDAEGDVKCLAAGEGDADRGEDGAQ